MACSPTEPTFPWICRVIHRNADNYVDRSVINLRQIDVKLTGRPDLWGNGVFGPPCPIRHRAEAPDGTAEAKVMGLKESERSQRGLALFVVPCPALGEVIQGKLGPTVTGTGIMADRQP